MKNHTKIYFKYFNYTGQEYIECEICNSAPSVDIHHIVSRGMGGVKNNRLDVIFNLMAVCRACHDKYGDNPEQLEFLVKQHAKTMKMNFKILMDKMKLI